MKIAQLSFLTSVFVLCVISIEMVWNNVLEPGDWTETSFLFWWWMWGLERYLCSHWANWTEQLAVATQWSTPASCPSLCRAVWDVSLSPILGDFVIPDGVDESPVMVSVISVIAHCKEGHAITLIGGLNLRWRDGRNLAHPGQLQPAMLEPQEAAGHSCSTSWGSSPSSLGYRDSLKSLCFHLNLTQFSCIKSHRMAFSFIILLGWPAAPAPWARTVWSTVTSSLPLLDASFSYYGPWLLTKDQRVSVFCLTHKH